MMVPWYDAEIAAAAGKFQLDPGLVAAVVLVESSGKTMAYRYEPDFWRRYLAKNPTYAQMNPERVSASYGLMQILYVVAYELGFTAEPETLCVPSIGLNWGCSKLATELRFARSGAGAAQPATAQVHAALAAYNGGRAGNLADDLPDRNAAYADKVLARLALVSKPEGA